jgi:transposase
MIDPDKRKAIFQLHREGMFQSEISRRLHVSRKTVRKIIRQQGEMPNTVRKDKREIDPDLLRRLYHECRGWAQRVHERLQEEEHIQIGYSTLTRMLRDLGLGKSQPARCDRVPDEPGAEMQHDTTEYYVRLAGQSIKVIASLLYLRYCKRRYLKFYRVFNRFVMKCFLHEALMFWGYSAGRCIIDNTNLARLRGTGKQAVIAPEMDSFSKRYGFQFECHALQHCNRKAGNERGFWTVETNFLPGRTFASLEDLNQQAKQWATVRMEHRAVGKARLIPAKAFEFERGFLTELPKHLPAPYQVHERGTDQYGYVHFNANFYWVPGTKRQDVKVLEYADQVKFFVQRNCVAVYPLPPDGVKNERFSPPGQPQPRHQPKNRKREAREEDKRLRAMGDEVAKYLDYALKTPGIQRHRFTRQLFALSRQVPETVFVQTVERALRYRIVELETLRRIAWLCLSQGEYPLPDAQVDEDFQQRPAYQEGCLTDEPDLSIYDDMLKQEQDNQPEDQDRSEESEDQDG